MSNGAFNAEPIYQQSYKETVSGSGQSVRIPVTSEPQRLDSAYISRIVTTQSSISTMFGSAPTIIDFSFTPSGIDVSTSLYCSFVVTAGATGVALMPTYMWFSFIECEIDGNNVSTIYDVDSMYQYLVLNTDEYVQSTQNLVGYTGAGQAFTPYTIGATATVELIMPLNNLTPFLTSGILNGAIRSSLKLRFHMKPISEILSSTANGNASLVCSQFQIINGGIALDGSALLKSRLNFQSSNHIYPCTVTQKRILNPGALSAGISSGRLTINSSQGLYSGVQALVYDLSGITVDDLLQPERLRTLTFYDASGSTINFENSFSRLLQLNAQTFPLAGTYLPNASTRYGFYVPFATHFRSSLQNLYSAGALRMLGSEQVEITPNASLTNAQIVLHLYQVAQVALDTNGVLVFAVRS